MSPATGTPVRLVDDNLVKGLTTGVEDIHYMGELAGTSGVRLPLSIPDFSGNIGAYHGGIYGVSGSGKALQINTPIPTPNGWTTMGELRDGDIVFDDMGKPTRVVKAHDVLYNRDCYEVVFSDGSVIVADAEHLWETETARSRQKASLERRVRKRRRLIKAETCAMLSEVAEAASPLDVITISEVLSLPGMEKHKVLVTTQAKRVGPAGTVQQMRPYNVRVEKVRAERPCVVWPAREILIALKEDILVKAANSNSEKHAKSLPFIEEALLETGEGQWLSSPDIARILRRPTRNAALTKVLKELPVPSEKRYVPVSWKPKQVDQMRATSPITVYPKATLLKAIAEHGANTWRDQRDKCTEQATGVRTTREILDTLYTQGARQAANHAVRVAKPLELPEADLPISPYLLGVWLGDGYSRSGKFGGVDHEIAEFLRAEGYSLTVGAMSEKNMERLKDKNYRVWKVEGLCAQLSSLGLIQRTTAEGSQKRIPDIYLRASIAQRRALLAGLLDTDGTVSSRGTIHFDNMNEVLARQVRELALSLGYRATMTSKMAKITEADGSVTEYGITFRVAWTTDEQVFRLTRKVLAHRERCVSHNSSKNGYRYIVEVRPVESVPMRCITVDSPSHLYLAGESMIPTHNTAVTSFYLATQMRHENMGIVVVDPQGQWAAEQGMVFSVQGFAQELGRDVRVRRISTDLRLDKDAPLLTELLKHTELAKDLGLKSESTLDIVWHEIAKALRVREDWTKDDSSVLLRYLLEYLRLDETAERVYTTPDNRRSFVGRLDNTLNDPVAYENALHQFAPIHNLFQETNPSGGLRHDLWRTLAEVFDRPAGQPAPLLILDMSSAPLPGMDEEVSMSARAASEILERDTVKAAVLRNLFRTLKRASEEKFRAGANLNTMIVLDEAWRYAAPPGKTDENEIAELSKDLAGYARDTRKFGIGWLYISQSTRSVNLDIWDQMTLRFFGYGLSGADLDKMAEIVDDRSALRLYRTFGNPRSTGVYPFLVTGPVSPLAANATPLTLHVYTDFDEFRADNDSWIRAIRDKLGVPVLSGLPAAPLGSVAGPKPKLRGKPRNMSAAILDSSETARENRKAVGVKDSAGFADPLAGIDDDVPF